LIGVRTKDECEARAIWKLEQGGYAVRRTTTGYVVTAPDGTQTELDDLAALIAFADAVYDWVWTGRRITPSA
jgi:hypothetical protein